MNAITVLTKSGRIIGHATALALAAAIVWSTPSDWYMPGTTALFFLAFFASSTIMIQVEKRYPQSGFFDRSELQTKAQFKAVKELNKKKLELCCECQLKPGTNRVDSYWCDSCHAEWLKYR